MKLDKALQKLTSLEGVRAAFVFDQYFSIEGRDVPPNYSNEILKRIAQQLAKLMSISSQTGAYSQEYRISFEKYGVLVRAFSQSYYLAIFLDNSIDPMEIRQPVNLAILVLEKALRGESDSEAQNEMGRIAAIAEKRLRDSFESDTSFLGKFRRVCFDYFGNAGTELIENGVEAHMLSMPLQGEGEMRKLADYVIERVPHPLKQQLLAEDADQIIRQTFAP